MQSLRYDAPKYTHDHTTIRTMTDKSRSTGGGFMNKLNNMAGGGQTGEQKEDPLDKSEHSRVATSTTFQLTSLSGRLRTREDGRW